MSEAGWKTQKAKLESSQDYIIVRKSRKAGSIAGEATSEGKDGIATTYFEINKNDLGAAGGGGYDDTRVWLELDNLQQQIDDLDIPDITDLATKAELAALKKTVDDHLLNHPAGGGDTVQLEADVAQLLIDVAELQDGLAKEIKDRELGDQALQNQIDIINTSGYDDTELRGLISDEEDSRVEGDKDLQDQIDALEGFDSTELKEKDTEQDVRLDAIETEQEEQNKRLDDIDVEQKEQNDRLDALEADDCGNVIGHFVNGWNYYLDGGAEARDTTIKLHKPSSNKGGEHGDLDDRNVWETTGSLQQGDIVYFKVGDQVYEREYSRRSELQYYYDLTFTEQVNFIPKDTEFFMLDAPECAEEIPEHDHEGMVVSNSVTTIVRLTEAEYEALADKDPSTLYLVV